MPAVTIIGPDIAKSVFLGGSFNGLIQVNVNFQPLALLTSPLLKMASQARSSHEYAN